MRYFKKWLVLVIAFLLISPIVGTLGNVNTSIGAAEPKIYVQVDKQHPSDVQKAIDNGLEVIEEYPAYLYGKATKPQFEEMKNDHLLVTTLKDPNPVYINGGVIYPANDDTKSFIGVTIPEGFEENYYSDVNEPNYYLVKFTAPVKGEWVNELQLNNIELVEYYHQNAYVVRCTPANKGTILRADYVSAMMPYVPAFKVPPDMNTEDKWHSVLVSFWAGVDPMEEHLKIWDQSQSALLSYSTASNDAFSIGTVAVNFLNIHKLAAIPSIQCIELPPDNMQLKVDIGREIVGVHLVDQAYAQGETPVRLDGSGELVAVYDSGLSGGYSALSADFSGRVPYAMNYAYSYSTLYGGWPRCYSGYANRYNSNPTLPGRGKTMGTSAAYRFSFDFYWGNARWAYNNGVRGPANYCDVWGHGTHVTSVIGGNGSMSGGQYKGVAPNVRFFVQRITPSWDTLDFWPGGTYPQYADRDRHPRNEDRPANTHPNFATPAIWDGPDTASISPDGASAGYYSMDEVPYKWDMSPLPPEDIPPTGPFPSFHDVPSVSGEVYGPEFGPIDPSGTNYAPEQGPPNNPGAPYYSGAAGTVNFAMNDAYQLGARIQNNSWWFYFLRTRQGYSPDPGSPVFSTYDYNAISRFVDHFQYSHQDFLTVWAAGDNGRDRDLDGIVDVQKDINGDMTYGDPWIDGENQTFFAPAPNKNGITVGAAENYRPDLNDLTYGDSGSTQANFGLFLTGDLPEWSGIIRDDLIANANEPLPLNASPEEILRGYSDHIAGQRLVDDPTGKFGMAAISTRGPSSDGRIKPDLVAPGTMVVGKLSVYNYQGSGNQTQYPYEYDYTTNLPDSDYAYMSGTSVSAGFVSGAAALVRQYYRQVEDLNIAPTPTAALIKGTLIHGATNMAEKDAPNQYDIIQEGQRVDETFNDTTSIADPNQGWGLLNVYNSLFPIPPRVQKYDDNITGVDADVVTYEVYVDNTDVPFEVTLCWTDESATPNSWPVLKHNLDLVVVDPAGLIYRGNQFGTPPAQDPNVSVPMATSTDTLNNVERIVINKPKMKGKYRISVVPSSLPKAPGGPVKYAIVYSGGFTDIPMEEPIPSSNPFVLALVGLALLGAGALVLRKRLHNN
jgi:subtilisin family serine protease